MMLHMLQWLHTYVSSECFKCFICFHTYVGSVLFGCYKSEYGCYKSGYGCYIYMHAVSVCFQVFRVFHLDAAYVCNGYTCIFLVFQTYVASVSAVSDLCCKCFIWMLQSRSGVVHVAIGLTCRSRLLQLLRRRRGSLCGRLKPADTYRHSSTCGAGGWDPHGRRRSRVRGGAGMHACGKGGALEIGWSPLVRANPPYARILIFSIYGCSLR
jgi:hypothetical protein